MIVREILTEVMEKYPHSLTDDSIITKINTIQQELFRTIYKPIETSQYDILADSSSFGISYSPSKVIDVLVNGEEYVSLNIKGKSATKFYWFSNDSTIEIYPTPEEDIPDGLTVFRYKEPRLLTKNDMEVKPDFDHDFHMLIVYRICKQLAENNRDFDIANGIIIQINGLMNDFNKGKQEPDYLQIQDVYGGCLL